MAIQKVIFDVGQVLVKFNPQNLFIKILKDEEKVDFFLKNICTWEWHIQQDLIYDTSKAAGPVIKKYPEYKEAIEAFYGRFLEMIDSVHQENVNLALKLKQKGYPIYLLSNFPGDQFEKYRLQNSFLNEFDDRIISGDVGLAKPDIKIYQLAIKKFNLNPEESLFIDDKIENTKAAEQAGIKTIQLQNPEDLDKEIRKFIDL
ncbi:HAD superfamily hydrolase [Candidatus Pelagibacter sp. IMCC9063]|uniref:HAD family hydrolase n=1 Tax=Pelagibacter sp. (strain IMCC9063) TaxID=1002672 RepID=UPI000204661E|nr:HAD family phosphatase [Candidatus Pelagibacter sp. IMCC9063]AEA81308.1 HAD superfamily hydrolase [Candidatus Pelagibacter sp. IMCC9063]